MKPLYWRSVNSKDAGRPHLIHHHRSRWNEMTQNEWDDCGEVLEWNLWRVKLEKPQEKPIHTPFLPSRNPHWVKKYILSLCLTQSRVEGWVMMKRLHFKVCEWQGYRPTTRDASSQRRTKIKWRKWVRRNGWMKSVAEENEREILPITKSTWNDGDTNSGPQRWEPNVYPLPTWNRIIINY